MSQDGLHVSPLQIAANSFSDAVMKSGYWGALGYIVSASAALHLMVSSVVSVVTEPLFSSLFYGEGATQNALIVGYVLKICTTAALSAITVVALGFPINFWTAFILTAIQDVLFYLLDLRESSDQICLRCLEHHS